MISKISFLSVAALVISAPLQAQTYGAPRPGQYGLAMEAMRPQFKDEGSDGISGATVLLAAHAQMSPRVRVLTEVPFSFASADGASNSSSSIGNPYVGLQIGNKPVSLNIGGRVPLVSIDNFEDDYSFAVGLLTDLERWSAYLPETATLEATVRFEHTGESGVGLALLGGSSYWISTLDDPDVDGERELLFTYGLEVSYQSRIIRTGIRAIGLANPDDDNLFDDNSVHQLAGFAELARGVVRPLVQLRLPLDSELKEATRMSGGVGVQIVLDRR